MPGTWPSVTQQIMPTVRQTMVSRLPTFAVTLLYENENPTYPNHNALERSG
jgi:hypothetical protein